MNNNEIEASIKHCQDCGKILHGRSDQRFCNDTCRNNFNRRKRKAEKIIPHENAAEIIRIIWKNYEILKNSYRHQMLTNEMIVFKGREHFIQSGINPKFFTSIHTDKNGLVWYCVFERCFTIGEEQGFVTDIPEQAKID
jgi:predicted nucleic acid-binding Zn ribbon protein